LTLVSVTRSTRDLLDDDYLDYLSNLGTSPVEKSDEPKQEDPINDLDDENEK